MRRPVDDVTGEAKLLAEGLSATNSSRIPVDADGGCARDICQTLQGADDLVSRAGAKADEPYGIV